MDRLLSACVAFFCLAACAGTPPSGWVRAEDNSAARAGDMAQCRSEATRLAIARYPDQIQQSGGTTHRISHPDRFAAELRLYDECMTRLGYRRAETKPAS